MPQAQASVIDSEWEQFQQAVLNPPDEDDTYQRATVFAEPVLTTGVPEGFPPLEDNDLDPVPEQFTEEQKRQMKEREERELIMDRLLEEERRVLSCGLGACAHISVLV